MYFRTFRNIFGFHKDVVKVGMDDQVAPLALKIVIDVFFLNCEICAFCSLLYSTVQGIGKFRADLLFSHQTFVKWPLIQGHIFFNHLVIKIFNFSKH